MGTLASKLTLDLAVELGKFINEKVFGEVDKWAEEYRVDDRMRSKLRELKVDSKQGLEALAKRLDKAFEEIVAEKDKRISELERKIANAYGNEDTLRAIAKDIRDVLNWMEAFDHALTAVVSKWERERVRMGHAVLPDPPVTLALPAHQPIVRRLNELRDWVKNARGGMPTFDRLKKNMEVFKEDRPNMEAELREIAAAHDVPFPESLIPKRESKA